MTNRTKTKIITKGKKVSKGSVRIKGDDYKLSRKFDGKKYDFAVGVGYKRDVEFQKNSLKKRYKHVRVVPNKLGYFLYVR